MKKVKLLGITIDDQLKFVISNLKERALKLWRKTKLLCITIDDQLKFEEHIVDRKLKGSKDIKGIHFLLQYNHWCSQDTYMKHYKSLVLPVIDYGPEALELKEFWKVQLTALHKATGCMANTSLENLEIISNWSPVHLTSWSDDKDLQLTWGRTNTRKLLVGWAALT